MSNLSDSPREEAASVLPTDGDTTFLMGISAEPLVHDVNNADVSQNEDMDPSGPKESRPLEDNNENINTNIDEKTKVHITELEGSTPAEVGESSSIRSEYEELQIQSMALKECPQTQPDHLDSRHSTFPLTILLASKFSYEPRPDESSYYQGLFNYVASFLNSGKWKTEVTILPPKLVAQKLFLASKIPPEKLRVIWNMATAVKSGSEGGSEYEEDQSTDMKESSNVKETSRTDSQGKDKTLVVVTQPQFNTMIRLIQLFQNRTSATDLQLKKINKSKLSQSSNGKAKGALMQGKLVKCDEDGSLPAYFAGISGVILAIPGSIEYKMDGGNILKPIKRTKSSAVLGSRRRTLDNGKLTSTISLEGRDRRRSTVTGEMQNKVTNEQRMKYMEKEINQLKSTVQFLQKEMLQLKGLSYSSGRNNGMTHPTSSSSCLSKGVHHRPTQDLSNIGSRGTISESTRTPSIGLVNDLDTSITARDENAPNTGVVESFWESNNETSDAKYPVKLTPSLRNKVQHLGKQAKKRIEVKDVASFDPKPNNISTNIPATHPSASKQPNRVQSKINGANPRGMPNLSQSDSTTATNGSTNASANVKKLRNSVGSVGQTSSEISPQGDHNNPNVNKLRTSLGHADETNFAGVKLHNPSELNGSLVRIHSTTPNTRQTSASASIDPNVQRPHKNSPPASFKYSNEVHKNSMWTKLRGNRGSLGSTGQLKPAGVKSNRRSNAFNNSMDSLHNPRPAHESKNFQRYRRSIQSTATETTAPTSNGTKIVQTNCINTDTIPSNHKQRVAPRPRLSKEALTSSFRHIVRNKDGTTHIYEDKHDNPKSTAAVDVQRLKPAPLTTSEILKNIENENKQKKKVLIRRLSSSNMGR